MNVKMRERLDFFVEVGGTDNRHWLSKFFFNRNNKHKVNQAKHLCANTNNTAFPDLHIGGTPAQEFEYATNRKIWKRRVTVFAKLANGKKGKTGKTAKPMRSPYDVNGSYTGTPEDGGKPVQDADDL